MNIKPPEETGWSWWQTPYMRNKMKRKMMPVTIQRAVKRRVYNAGLYFLFTFVWFNYFVYREVMKYYGSKNHTEAALQTAMDINFTEGTIVKLENFKISSVTQFDRDDFDEQQLSEKLKQ